MSRTALTSGTFDPPTLGHLDIVARAAALFDRVVIGVFTNAAKQPLFTLEERLAIVARETAGFPAAIEVVAARGLLVDLARQVGATAIVRGLRSGTDLDYEEPMAAMNRAMAPTIDTVFLAAAPALRPIASSLVKEVARGGGDIHPFVSPAVAADVMARLGR